MQRRNRADDNFQNRREMLLPLLLLLLVHFAAGDEPRPLSVTVCETHVLEADCSPRQVIRVVRANYGRTSNDPCNEDHQEWDTSCVSNSSTELMTESCTGRQTCEVVASNFVFPDPCPGVDKYLEMEFVCEPDPNAATVPPVPLTPPPAAVPEGERPFLLYCNTHELRKLDLVSMQDRVLVSGLNRSVVVDYDFARNVVVWTDSKEKAVFSGDMSSGDKRLLVANVTSYGVAVDWVHMLVYWTDSAIDVIDVMTLDGGKRRTLFSNMLDEPRGIVLDPGEGYMYWSDWGEVPKIEKSGMDGSGRKVIVSIGLKWPNGLSIDLDERRLYWIEAFHENLCSSDLEGKDVRRILANSPFLKLPFSIDVFQEWVYWTEWTSNKENIFRADKKSGANLTRVLDGDTTLMGIKVYHSSKQKTVSNACGDSNGGCSHLCLPSPPRENFPNYTCACPNGMEATPDLFNCTAAPAVQATLLYCNRHDIRQYDLSTGSDSLVVGGLQRATVIDFHYERQMVVWTDTDQKKIYRASLSSVGTRLPVAESVTSYGVAVDWLHDHIYWTDTLNNRLEVADINSTGWKRTLFSTDLDEPRAIVLNPHEGWMWWSDWGEVPKIERSGMDGAHRRVIVSRDIRWPNGLAIDVSLRQLFWVDGKLNTLCTVDFEGGHRRTLIASSSLMKHPFSLDVLEEWLYWVEWSSGKESVYRARKEDGSRAEKLFDGERTLMGLKVFDPDKQPPISGVFVCNDDNGPCSHLCLPAPSADGELATNYTCACPNNLFLQPDGYNCSSSPAPSSNKTTELNFEDDAPPLLLLANVDDIRVIDLRTHTDTRLIGDLTRAVAIDYLHRNKTVVWTDIREDRICSAPLRPSGLVTELVSECSHSDGLAVDWVQGGNLYWTDKGKDAVEVASADGAWRRTLFSLDLDEPRAIALDPFLGWMFWTDWGRVPKIERAGMDGTHRRVIVSRNVQWPNGITVDLELRRVYWADAKTHEISSVNYEGVDRKVILMSWSYLKQPFSIDIVQDVMYWVEWRAGEECVYRADKLTGSNVTKIVDGRRWKNIMAIRVFHSSKQPPGENRCGNDNGGCSHLCVPTPPKQVANYSCLCPNHLQLAYNGRDCLAQLPDTTTTEREIPTEPPPTTGRHGTGAEMGRLLYANRRDVRWLDLYTKEDNLLAEGFQRAAALDFHFNREIVVWTDSEAKQIYSAPLWSGLPQTTLVAGNTTANGVAVDWVHDLIFWTDDVRNSVSVMTVDGRLRKTLLKGGEVEQPRTIVVHPTDGWLFWTDWGRRPKIERAGMDGTHRQTIVATAVDWTHALTIDVYQRRLYWANGDSKKILCVNFDGSLPRTILHAPNLLHLPFSMDNLHENLYWTEFLPLHETIFRTNKYSGADTVKVLDKSWTSLMGIKIHHRWKQPPGVNRCGANNGRCSHLCLPTPRRLPHVTNNFTCSCPDDMLLDTDGATCVSAQGKGSLTTDKPSTTPPDAGNSSVIENEKAAALRATDSTAPIIIGTVAALVLIVLVGVFVYHRQFLHRNLGNIIFNNPVYRRQTEDVSIEKSGRKSLVPLTSEFSELE